MAEPQAQMFELAKEPCKIMRKSFPANIQERIGAKVSWEDFGSALQKLKFNIKSLDGSVSLFKPACLNLPFSFMSRILETQYALTYCEFLRVG